MEIDNLISKARILRKKLENECLGYHIQHNCNSPIYIDKGYYRRHNGDYCIVQEEKNDADFRLLECECCQKEFFLINTGVTNWDSKICEEEPCAIKIKK